MGKYKSDLEYLFKALIKHPMFIREPEKLSEFKEFYKQMLSETDEDSFDDFVMTATAMTVYFRDGHTNIEIPYSENDVCLFMPCDWKDSYTDGLVMSDSSYGIPRGAEIVTVEGMSITELVDKMAEVIPHENRYLVKSRMLHYPYINYHVFSEMNVHRLFGCKDKYTVEVLADGQTIRREIALTSYNNYPAFSDDKCPFYYEFDEDGNRIAVHIDACICNRKYENFLREAACICEEKYIDTMLLDLSKNMGGTTEVIDRFIAYTQAEKYRQYAVFDYSEGCEKILSDRNAEILNRRSDKLFPSDIRLKVSCDTFSSARTFAVTLLDNGIATLEEGCLGGKPDSYGAPIRGVMPESGIRFRVSTRYFMRPDGTRDEEKTVLS